MRLSPEETALIELLRQREPFSLMIQRHETTDEFIVTTGTPPYGMPTTLAGVGMSFAEAWRTRRRVPQAVVA